jgi:hypothetical protein
MDKSMSLLDDNDSLEDPFTFGAENIWKDIMQDEIIYMERKRNSYIENFKYQENLIKCTPAN